MGTPVLGLPQPVQKRWEEEECTLWQLSHGGSPEETALTTAGVGAGAPAGPGAEM